MPERSPWRRGVKGRGATATRATTGGYRRRGGGPWRRAGSPVCWAACVRNRCDQRPEYRAESITEVEPSFCQETSPAPTEEKNNGDTQFSSSHFGSASTRRTDECMP